MILSLSVSRVMLVEHRTDPQSTGDTALLAATVLPDPMEGRLGAKSDQGILNLNNLLMPAHEAADGLGGASKRQVGAPRAELIRNGHGKMAGAAMTARSASDPGRKLLQGGSRSKSVDGLAGGQICPVTTDPAANQQAAIILTYFVDDHTGRIRNVLSLFQPLCGRHALILLLAVDSHSAALFPRLRT
jgi:hypothetical protein